MSCQRRTKSEITEIVVEKYVFKIPKSKSSEILEISRNKCTLKRGGVLLSLQVARCLSSGEQRHKLPLDYHHHRRHISIEEDLKSSNLTVFIIQHHALSQPCHSDHFHHNQLFLRPRSPLEAHSLLPDHRPPRLLPQPGQGGSFLSFMLLTPTVGKSRKTFFRFKLTIFTLSSK